MEDNDITRDPETGRTLTILDTSPDMAAVIKAAWNAIKPSFSRSWRAVWPTNMKSGELKP